MKGLQNCPEDYMIICILLTLFYFIIFFLFILFYYVKLNFYPGHRFPWPTSTVLMSSALVGRHIKFSSLGWDGFHSFDILVDTCEDGTLFPVASLDFTFRNRETNDHVKRSLTWNDPELEKIFPVFFLETESILPSFLNQPIFSIQRRVTEFQAILSYQHKVQFNVKVST